MNLDELINSIPQSEFKLKNNLTKFIANWKGNTQDVDELEDLIERWYGNVWFQDTNMAKKFYGDFCEFRENAINGIGGMTVNERLYWFSLFELWDLNDLKIQSNIKLKLKVHV